jgi:phasin
MAISPKKGAAPQTAPATAAEPLTEAVTNPVETTAEAVQEAAESIAGMQESARAALEKGVADSRAALVKAKGSADEAANAFELSFAAAKDGAVAINAKALEALRANAEANFEFVKASLTAKSLSDLVALQSEFARKQVDAMTGQAKDISALTQKTMVSAIEPLKDQMAKSFKIAV